MSCGGSDAKEKNPCGEAGNPIFQITGLILENGKKVAESEIGYSISTEKIKAGEVVKVKGYVLSLNSEIKQLAQFRKKEQGINLSLIRSAETVLKTV